MSNADLRLYLNPGSALADRPDYESHEIPCRDADPDDFFPVNEAVSGRYAQQLCTGCPLLHECLEYALNTNEQGIWGGTTTKARHVIRRRRLRVAAGIKSTPCRATHSCYTQGCRTDACRAAHRAAVSRSREARLESGRLQHGIAGYNDGCRCDVCREAKRDRRRGVA